MAESAGQLQSYQMSQSQKPHVYVNYATHTIIILLYGLRAVSFYDILCVRAHGRS